MERVTNSLVKGIRNILGKQGVPGIVNQVGPVFQIIFTTEKIVEDFAAFNKRDSGKYARFAAFMLEEGVLIRPNGLWYVSAVHGEEEVASTLDAVNKVMARLQE